MMVRYYKNFSPFMKERDELVLAPEVGDIIKSREAEELWWSKITRSSVVSEASEESSPPMRTRRLKIWTVPLSLDTANHRTSRERAMPYISALSAPLRTCAQKEVELLINWMPTSISRWVIIKDSCKFKNSLSNKTLLIPHPNEWLKYYQSRKSFLLQIST